MAGDYLYSLGLLQEGHAVDRPNCFSSIPHQARQGPVFKVFRGITGISGKEHGTAVGQVDKYSASGKSVWVDLGDAIGVQRFAENSLEVVRGARVETGQSGWKEKTQRMSVGKGDEQRVESERVELALVDSQ